MPADSLLSHGASKKSVSCILFFIIVIGFWLRLWGIQFGLPHLFHADEPIIVNHALAYGSLDFNPHFFKIPPLTSYFLFAVYVIYYLLGQAVGFFHDTLAFENLFYTNPSSFYLLGRVILGVLPGTLSIYLLFLVTTRIFKPITGLIAAYLMAVCFLHVRDSHFIYTDMLLLTALISAYGALWGIFRHPDQWKSHIACAILIGVAAAIKYNGIFFILPYIYLIAVLLRFKAFKYAAVFSVISATVFTLLNPFALVDCSFFIQELKAQSQAHGRADLFHHLTYSLVGAAGIPLTLIFLCACVRAIQSRHLLLQAAAFFIIAYYFVITEAGQPYDRYVLPLIPFFIILSADLIEKTVDKWAPISHRRLIMTCFVFIISIPTLFASIRSDLIMAETDIRVVAKKWIEEHIPSGSRIAMGIKVYCPPLNFSETQLLKKKQIMAMENTAANQMRRLDALLSRQRKFLDGYELFFLSRNADQKGFLYAMPQVAYSMESLIKENIEYVILPVLAGGDQESEFEKTLAAHADLIQSFSPYQEPSRMIPFDHLALTGGPFLWKELLERKQNGMPLKVYKLKKALA